MGAYIPVIVWLISLWICHVITRRRGATPGLAWRLFAVFFGPFAIPFAFLVKKDHS